MNDHSEFPTEQDDAGHGDGTVEALLAQLKRMEPSLNVRVANRTAVAAELARWQTEIQHGPLPWWRRSVSIPIPIAVSLTVLVLVGVAFGWSLSGASGSKSLHSQDSDMQQHEAVDLQHASRPIATRETTAPPRLEYYETRMYLCGVGSISLDSGYENLEEMP